jgi:transcriptional regulator with XRE-family HTH domain
MGRDTAFGRRLAELRAERGLSLRQFGDLAHYSRSHLHDLEHGVRQPTPNTACRATHCPVGLVAAPNRWTRRPVPERAAGDLPRLRRSLLHSGAAAHRAAVRLHRSRPARRARPRLVPRQRPQRPRHATTRSTRPRITRVAGRSRGATHPGDSSESTHPPVPGDTHRMVNPSTCRPRHRAGRHGGDRHAALPVLRSVRPSVPCGQYAQRPQAVAPVTPVSFPRSQLKYRRVHTQSRRRPRRRRAHLPGPARPVRRRPGHHAVHARRRLVADLPRRHSGHRRRAAGP